MSVIAILRRKTYTALLLLFRHLPAPVRRTLVRLGTPGFTVGAVVAIEHDGHVLFLRQPHREGWSLPGGLLTWNESPAQAVVREVYEETAIRLEVGDPFSTEVLPRVRRIDVIYRVRADERPGVRVGGEAKDFRWWRPEDVPEADAATRDILGALTSGRHRREGRLLSGA